MPGPVSGPISDSVSEQAGIARDYHRRTSHRLEAYARGPEALDWSGQPDPFRHFDGAPQIKLPLIGAAVPQAGFADLFSPGTVEPRALNLKNIAALLELALGISAWKSYMGDRWALRCNPSSGNLHPTEGYVVCAAIPGVSDGVYHYRPDEHLLEQRAATGLASEHPRLIVGLSSILWREGWKYGERAFRYCQLDIGHAVGAFSYAAAALGWRIRMLDHHGGADIAALLGLGDAASFTGAEPEVAELLFEVSADADARDIPTEWFAKTIAGKWTGKANRLDPEPYGDWPVLAEIAAATARCVSIPPTPPGSPQASDCFAQVSIPAGNIPAASLIRQRRSAQHFDPRPLLPLQAFMRLLDAVLPRPGTPPWPLNMDPARTHLVLFVNRVEGLRQGLYALPRSAAGRNLMQQEMRPTFAWQKEESAPQELPLYMLVHADCRNAARTLSCHQAIAGDASFAVAMLGEFDATIDGDVSNYRRLFVEAGLIGQSLYLEAENAGFRGTGIGCYFDPAVHDTLGIDGTALQSMYHFTVGMPLVDERIQTLPAYAHLKDRNL